MNTEIPCSEDTGHHFETSWVSSRSICTCGDVILHTTIHTDNHGQKTFRTTFRHSNGVEPYHLAQFTVRLSPQ